MQIQARQDIATLIVPIATLTGNNIFLNAAKNIHLTAAEVTSDNQIIFYTEGNLLLDAIQKLDRVTIIANKSYFTMENILWQGNNINAAGNIKFNSGGNIGVEAGNIHSEGSIDITTKGSLALLSKENHQEIHARQKKQKSGFGRSKKTTSSYDYLNTTQSRPQITAKDNLSIVAQQDIVVQSAVLKGETSRVHAEGKIHALAVKELHS